MDIKKITQRKYEKPNFHGKKYKHKKDSSIQEQELLSKSLNKNVDNIINELKLSKDVKRKTFSFGNKKQYKVCAIYIDGIADTDLMSVIVFEALSKAKFASQDKTSKLKMLQKINNEVLWSSDTSMVNNYTDAIEGCLRGDTVLFMDGCNKALVINTKGGQQRTITEPESEAVVRGPREGFTENFRTNTALIRKKLRCKDLKVEQMSVGKKTNTQVCLVYLNNVAKHEIVDKVRNRIASLNVEAVLESGYIEQYIEDHPWSIFPTINYSEKPDVITAKVLEGRVAIVIDGTPFVLTAPMLFVESFQTAEDFYNRPIYASFIRLIRYMAYFISVFAPAIYVALTSFHQELIPTKLLISLIKAIEGTPFPIFMETLLMVVAFEFLREAGIRLPRSVGQAISIVGALIMGEAAVSAGIVGAPTVIVVAFTAVCGFMIPTQNNSSTLLRFFMIICAAIFGWFGIVMGFIFILTYLATLKSFGVAYFDSFSNVYDLKDTMVRVPLWVNAQRPVNLAGKDDMRTSSDTTLGNKKDIIKEPDYE